MSATTFRPEDARFDQSLVLIAARRFAMGATMAQVVDVLVARGETTTQAAHIAVAGRTLKHAVFRRSGARTMLAGLAIAAISVGVTSLSHDLASPGGTYIVATGAMVVGAINFARGLWRMIFG